MKAVKGNKEYSIEESQKKFYKDRGFDIKDNKGKVIDYGRGKTVSYDEYEKLKEENAALKEHIKMLQADADVPKAKPKLAKKEKTDNHTGSSDDKNSNDNTSSSDDKNSNDNTGSSDDKNP